MLDVQKVGRRVSAWKKKIIFINLKSPTPSAPEMKLNRIVALQKRSLRAPLSGPRVPEDAPGTLWNTLIIDACQ